MEWYLVNPMEDSEVDVSWNNITDKPTIPVADNLSNQASVFGQSANSGTQNDTFARSDHYHALPSLPAMPVGGNIDASALNQTVAHGSAATWSRSDHRHAIPAIPAPDWNATSGVNSIANKPTIPSVNNGTLSIQQNGSLVQTFTANQSTDTIANIIVPAAQVNSDWNATTGLSQILNKPTIPSANIALTAETGSGTDITTPAVTSATINSVVQSVWVKIRQLGNVIASKFTLPSGGTSSQYINGTGALTTFPSIPTVNNATLTIQKNGTDVQTFTANASSNVTANITIGQTDVSNFALSALTASTSNPAIASTSILTHLQNIANAVAGRVPTNDSRLTDSRNPTGSAGGDLTGTYPNPTLAAVSRTNNTSTASPSAGGTFTAIDTVTSDTKGRITAVNTKTVTLPSGGSSGTVTSVSAGNGLDFTTITATGAVAMRTPASVTGSSTNTAGSSSAGHTHAVSGLTVGVGGTGVTSFTANSAIMSGSTTTAALTTRAIATAVGSSSTSTSLITEGAVRTALDALSSGSSGPFASGTFTNANDVTASGLYSSSGTPTNTPYSTSTIQTLLVIASGNAITQLWSYGSNNASGIGAWVRTRNGATWPTASPYGWVRFDQSSGGGGVSVAALSGQGTAAFGQSVANGSAATASRSDHVHALPSLPTIPAGANLGSQGTPTFGQSAANGSASTFARSDHYHALPSAPSAGGGLTTGTFTDCNAVTTTGVYTNSGGVTNAPSGISSSTAGAILLFCVAGGTCIMQTITYRNSGAGLWSRYRNSSSSTIAWSSWAQIDSGGGSGSYVLKDGDTMTGKLLLNKPGKWSVTSEDDTAMSVGRRIFFINPDPNVNSTSGVCGGFIVATMLGSPFDVNSSSQYLAMGAISNLPHSDVSVNTTGIIAVNTSLTLQYRTQTSGSGGGSPGGKIVIGEGITIGSGTSIRGISVLEGTTQVSGQGGGTVMFTYPDGYTKDNTCVLSVMVGQSTGLNPTTWRVLMIDNTSNGLVTLTANTIDVRTGLGGVQVRVVILRT